MKRMIPKQLNFCHRCKNFKCWRSDVWLGIISCNDLNNFHDLVLENVFLERREFWKCNKWASVRPLMFSFSYFHWRFQRSSTATREQNLWLPKKCRVNVYRWSAQALPYRILLSCSSARPGWVQGNVRSMSESILLTRLFAKKTRIE